MNKIIWLASYPKSGNTWFRAFISNIFSQKMDAVDVNNFIGGPIFSDKRIFDEYSGLSTEELLFDEIDMVRPDIYQELAEELEDDCFIKAHDAYTYLVDKRPIYPTKASRGTIYFVRNPFDVAVSFANHSNGSIDKTIQKMNRNAYFCDNTKVFQIQLRQKLLSWSDHYKSWINQKNIPVLVVKYEDMKKNPFEQFSKALKFSGFKFSDEQINDAIDKSSFSKLKEQEKLKGFNEKNPKSKSFFRKGESGSWREDLTDDQVKSLIDNHREVMVELNYLDNQDNILV